MAVTLQEIRDGLVTNIETQIDLTSTQIFPYILPDPTLPAIMVFPEKVEYDLAARRGLDRWTMTVQALVSYTLDQGAQQKLDLMLAPAGSGSIKAALESDPTLGGKVQTLTVPLCSGYQIYRIASRGALGAEWTVEIYATGN